MYKIKDEETKKLLKHLKAAAKIIKPDIEYSQIELIAAFRRGLDTITDPALMKK